MTDAARIVELGGIAAEEVPQTVGLLARSYTSPHLPGRTVVRLVREPLREVEDLSLGVLGLEPAQEAPVGRVRSRAIGFPAWPIIHDPANARHALNLVADLKRAAKLARSKAGPAKDLLDSLATTLGSSAPHFLPTFLEEGARIFIANDNLTYGAQYFAKAREAERVHNLAIDEDRHREVFLEFALAGALSAKELTNEAKSLQTRTTPEDALALFVKLNVDRVKGGLPPYASLSTDLRRLAKAAKADSAAVERGLLAQLLGSPALQKAPQGFWTGFLKPLVALAKQDPAVKESLLLIAPDNVKSDDWVGVLDAAGVSDELLSGRRPAAEWAQRYVRKLQSQWNASYPRRLSELIRRIPSLKGAQITLSNRLWRLQPELLNALIEAGAVVTFESLNYHHGIDLTDWASQPERPDLDPLAASEHAQLCINNLDTALRKGHLPTLIAHSGTRSMVKRWATPRLGSRPTLEQIHAELNRLRILFTPEASVVTAEELDRFTAYIDEPELLAAALRDGLATELTWPALERAASELARPAQGSARGPRPVRVHESWPAIGVSSGGEVSWVDGDRVVATASFTPPAGDEPESWKYSLVDGVTGCLYRTKDSGWQLTWSDDPAVSHRQGYMWPRSSESSLSFPVPGGRLFPDGLQRVGDDKPQFTRYEGMLHDGSGFWRIHWDAIKEVDPETGKEGRESLPTRLADLIEPHLRDGFSLSNSALMWHPVTPSTRESLLSTADGLHAWVTLHKDRQSRFVTLDGSVHDIPDRKLVACRGLIRRPGGGHWFLDSDGSLRLEESLQELPLACDSVGRPHLLHRVHRSGWHQFRVRDAEASRRLRSATADAVRPLLAVAPTAPQYPPCSDEAGIDLLTRKARDAAAALLGCKDQALVDSVVWLAARVKALTARVAALREASAAPTDSAGTFASWEPSSAVTSWWLFNRWHSWEPPRSAILALGSRLRGERADTTKADASALLPSVVPEAVLALAATPLRPKAEVEGAAALVGACLDAGLYTPAGAAYSFGYDRTRSDETEAGSLFDTPAGPNLSFGERSSSYSYQDRTIVALSPTGGIPARVLGEPTTELLRSSGIAPVTLVAAFEKLLSAGPPAWDPAKAARLAQGLGWSQAAAGLLLAGMPNIRGYEKNFLPKQVRELLGLKVAEADGARKFLQAIDSTQLIRLLSAGAQDPVRVVTEGLDIEAMIAWWGGASGDQRSFPDELFNEISSAFAWGGEQRLRAYLGEKITAQSNLPTLLWLAARLDRSSPAREWVAEWFDALRKAYLENTFTWNEWLNERVLRPRLGLPTNPGKDGDGPYQVGPWTVTGKNASYDEVRWRPSLVLDWAAEQRFIASLGPVPSEVKQCVELVTGAFDPIVADLRVSGSGPNQDPLITAPAVVASVMAELGLPEDAARYWLQLLALPNPTDRNVDAWNGWTKASRTAAAAPLLAAGLVVEAKRARAGRSYFLPGGWQEAVAPHLPMEVWKAPFFDLSDSLKVQPLHEVVVPLVPLSQLFADAWERYRGGDVPGYIELRTQRYRRRRS
ncbi:MAG: hypothetical protein Q4B08_02385 [Propionibacteriaceae bacterium]|nr:hypothetical protein [Propionibacteriaceae bacterium]